MSRLLWCTALIGLVMPAAVRADHRPGCTPRFPCLKQKVCCLKEKLSSLAPRCVKTPIYRPHCYKPCQPPCPQPCEQTCCKKTCCKQECCKQEPEIERIVVRMEQTPRLQMRTVMVPRQRVVMVPQVQTYLVPQTVVGGQVFGAGGVSSFGFAGAGAAVSSQQQNDAVMRAMASLLQQRLGQRNSARSQPRTLQQVDDDLKRLTERVEALEKAIRR